MSRRFKMDKRHTVFLHACFQDLAPNLVHERENEGHNRPARQTICINQCLDHLHKTTPIIMMTMTTKKILVTHPWPSVKRRDSWRHILSIYRCYKIAWKSTRRSSVEANVRIRTFGWRKVKCRGTIKTRLHQGHHHDIELQGKFTHPLEPFWPLVSVHWCQVNCWRNLWGLLVLRQV